MSRNELNRTWPWLRFLLNIVEISTKSVVIHAVYYRHENVLSIGGNVSSIEIEEEWCHTSTKRQLYVEPHGTCLFPLSHLHYSQINLRHWILLNSHVASYTKESERFAQHCRPMILWNSCRSKYNEFCKDLSPRSWFLSIMLRKIQSCLLRGKPSFPKYRNFIRPLCTFSVFLLLSSSSLYYLIFCIEILLVVLKLISVQWIYYSLAYYICIIIWQKRQLCSYMGYLCFSQIIKIVYYIIEI